MAGKVTRSVAERFWEKVDKSGDCWTWTASLRHKGYGQFMMPSRIPVKAHRKAWELARGPIPDGAHVLHRCDNPPCCNPDHLFLGSNDDNIADMLAKGRNARGTRVHHKLTVDNVLTIRRLHGDGMFQSTIARLFRIDQGLISRICNRTRWAHVA